MQHLDIMLAIKHHIQKERQEQTVIAIDHLVWHLSASVDWGFNKTLRNRT